MEPPQEGCLEPGKTWYSPTPKKQRDSLETKDAAAKQREQTQPPQIQAHDDCAKEVEEHDETPQELGDDDRHQRQP